MKVCYVSAIKRCSVLCCVAYCTCIAYQMFQILPGNDAGPAISDTNPHSTSEQRTSSVTQSPGSAGLACDSPVWDVGDVQPGEVCEHEFVLTNPGLEPVSVRRVSPGCGCIVATANEFGLAAGVSCRIPVRMTIQPVEGEFSRSIHVHYIPSGTADVRELELSVVGFAKPGLHLSVSPQVLNFGRVVIGERPEKILSLSRNDHKAFAALNIQSADGRLSQVGSVQPQARVDECAIRLQFRTDGLLPGKFHALLQVGVDGPDELQSATVRVTADVIPRRTGLIHEVSLGVVKSGDQKIVDLTDSGDPNPRPQISKCHYSGDEGLCVQPLSDDIGCRVVIRCESSPGRVRVLNGTLQVETLGDIGVVSIPLTAVCR